MNRLELKTILKTETPENSLGVPQVQVDSTLGVKVITPIVCQLCEMDWKHGACGDCTLTRRQLDGCIGLHRQLDLLTDMVTKLQGQLDEALDDHCDSH